MAVGRHLGGAWVRYFWLPFVLQAADARQRAGRSCSRFG